MLIGETMNKQYIQKIKVNKNHFSFTHFQSLNKYEFRRKRTDTKIIVISATDLENGIKHGNKKGI